MSATLKLAEPRASLLDAVLTLMQAKEDMTMTEWTDRILDIRGRPNYVLDAIDGLLLRAQDDDEPDQDYLAVKAMLESLRAEAIMLADRV